MSFSKKRVAVIGGGPCGIVATKCLKEEELEPVCYEKTSHFGGTWRYREDDVEGMPSLMSSTIINNSKEMGAISDFPPKAEYPNYMRHFEMMEMFQDFIKKFDILKHMVFNTEVTLITKTEDYETSGRWRVKAKNNETGETTEEIFDGVMVCVGHITYPKMITFPGLEKYRGKVMHTKSLKRVNEFHGQNIVVVGIGCSGLDAAVETSAVANQVYLSTRSGAWILPRVGPYGLPTDFAILRRYLAFLQYLSVDFASSVLERYVLDYKFNHSLYNLKSKYRVFCRDPSVSDLLPCKLITGDIVMKRNIKCFTERGVVFEGEDQITEADTVILATGYTWKFPFLEEGLITIENGRINLYKCIYPPQLSHPTLAIIGFLLPFSGLLSLAEIQCRWACHMFAGKGSLPSKEVMRAEIKTRHEVNVNRYPPSDKMTIRVDFVPYLDDIASQFGVKPKLLRMAFRDPKLFKACVFGPCLPYQFRLEGPHSWPGARSAILTAYDRMRKPLSGRDHPRKRLLRKGFILKYSLILLILCFFFTIRGYSIKYAFFTSVFFAPFLRWKNIIFKYIIFALMLPLFITWKGFSTHFLIILYVPLILALITSV